MVFKGRTVIAFILLAIFASSIVSLTIGNSMAKTPPAAEPAKQQVQKTASSAIPEKDLKKIEETYQMIEDKYVQKIDGQNLINGAITGMISALKDPFTVYMDPQEAKRFEDMIKSSFQGIGAQVTMENGKLTIVTPLKGSPAEKAGLRAGDIILSVNGEKLDGLSINQAVLKIRGPKGTQAKLEVLRKKSTQPKQIIVVRDEIKQDTIHAEMLKDGIGKIEITQFSFNTPQRFAEELKKLEDQHMKGLVIDVRNNPGGLLQAVVSIVEPFVPKGKAIVQIEDRNGKRVPTLSQTGAGKSYPVTVLINGGSASASEILAGAFEESVGSKLIGVKSFGKGTVQQTTDMGDGSNIKMTMFKWLTPDGNWIHKKGIMPDIVVDEPAYFTVAPLSKKSTLKEDTTSDDVKNLEIMLQGLGYKVDRTDGYFSKKTAQAVMLFQKEHQLESTGEVDKKTADEIETAIVKKIQDPKNDLQLNAAIDYLKMSFSQK